MADSKVNALTGGTTPADTDIFYALRDPFGAGDDVQLTWAQIKAASNAAALAANNSTHVANAQAAGVKGYASMSIRGNSTAETTTDGTKRKVEAWTNDDLEIGLDADYTTDDITVSIAGKYHCAFAFSCHGTADATYEFELYKNGGATGYKCQVTIPNTGTDPVAGMIQGPITFAADDTLEVYQSTADGTALTITEGQLSATYLAA